MKWIETFQNQIDIWIDQLQIALSRLSTRERIMVIAASIILIVAGISSGLWKMHSLADDQQKRLSQLKDDLVWMQSNVVTMKASDDVNLTAEEKITRASQQQGISIEVQPIDGKIQIVAIHENYSILANFLTQLAQMGLSIEKLELNKVDQAIKLTASVS